MKENNISTNKKNKKKNKKMLLLLLLIFFFAVSSGYYYIHYNEEFFAGDSFSKTQDSWNIGFTKILYRELVGEAKEYKQPYLNKYETAFYIHFNEPGDSVTYDIGIKNAGTLKAKINSILFSSNIIDQVDCKYENIKIGTTLEPSKSTSVRVKLSYNPKSNSEPRNDGRVSLIVNWIQAS